MEEWESGEDKESARASAPSRSRVRALRNLSPYFYLRGHRINIKSGSEYIVCSHAARAYVRVGTKGSPRSRGRLWEASNGESCLSSLPPSSLSFHSLLEQESCERAPEQIKAGVSATGVSGAQTGLVAGKQGRQNLMAG